MICVVDRSHHNGIRNKEDVAIGNITRLGTMETDNTRY